MPFNINIYLHVIQNQIPNSKFVYSFQHIILKYMNNYFLFLFFSLPTLIKYNYYYYYFFFNFGLVIGGQWQLQKKKWWKRGIPKRINKHRATQPYPAVENSPIAPTGGFSPSFLRFVPNSSSLLFSFGIVHLFQPLFFLSVFVFFGIWSSECWRDWWSPSSSLSAFHQFLSLGCSAFLKTWISI